MNNKSCRNCLFYLTSYPEDYQVSDGECRRFPPVIVVEKIFDSGSLLKKSYSPTVKSACWCGEYTRIASKNKTCRNSSNERNSPPPPPPCKDPIGRKGI